jgi:hypothetical protein
VEQLLERRPRKPPPGRGRSDRYSRLSAPSEASSDEPLLASLAKTPPAANSCLRRRLNWTPGDNPRLPRSHSLLAVPPLAPRGLRPRTARVTATGRPLSVHPDGSLCHRASVLVVGSPSVCCGGGVTERILVGWVTEHSPSGRRPEGPAKSFCRFAPALSVCTSPTGRGRS